MSIEPTEEDRAELVELLRCRRCWQALEARIAPHTDARGTDLVDLAVMSVLDCLAGGADVRAEDDRCFRAYAALEALVRTDGVPSVEIERTAADMSVSVIIKGDSICRDELADALFAMARVHDLHLDP
jgi:hypothetical protein